MHRDIIESLKVYKFLNFNNGESIVQAIVGDKTKSEAIDYFDLDWNKLDLRQNYPNCDDVPKQPKSLNEMIALSNKLKENFPFIRTDFYEIDEKVYFSEMTFYSDAGLEPFVPDEWDVELGKRVLLPNNVGVLR